MATVNIKNDHKRKSQLTQLYEMLRDMFQDNYYGSVEVKFEAGKVTIVRKTESIKI
jgi:hypothetical protein